MIETASDTTTAPEQITIPKSLIYEEIDGRPIYYRGYQAVLANQKTLEDIMGCSDVQGVIISTILEYLYQNVSTKQYKIITNEIGLHLARKSNLSADIALYDKAVLQKTPLKSQYFEIPPRAVIEIDTKADTSSFNTPADYYYAKTNKLFGFGVQEVLWIYTQTKKVMVARPQQDWIIQDWSKPVTLLEQYTFSIADLIEKDGIKLPS